MSVPCRDGHLSEELDYCSVCGASMGLPTALAPSTTQMPAMQNPTVACPLCGEPRVEQDARFCEVCRYDFVAGQPGPPPVGASSSSPTGQNLSSTASKPSSQGAAPVLRHEDVSVSAQGASWELVVTVDATLDTEPDPQNPCPRDRPPGVVAVDRAELLVGRHDDRRDIHPEIDLYDPGVSRRHAKFVRNPDGTLTVQDLDSINGTKVNGAPVPAGMRRPLTAGDEITVGRWTRMVMRVRT